MEVFKEARDALEEGMRKFDVCEREEFDRHECIDISIPMLVGKCRPQTAKQDGDRMTCLIRYNSYR